MIQLSDITKKKSTSAFLKVFFTKGLLGCCTYAIVIIALLLFGKIIIDGAPVILTKEAPFIDLYFITEKNESLHVFDDASGVTQQLPASAYAEYVKHNPDAPRYNESSYSYSGGGIAGPIAGTALLTIGAMILALFFGVSAAIYLSEYAKQGGLNLAGVPSIVFGLFGFAIFVLAVPIITQNPADRSLLVIPLMIKQYVISFQGWNSSLMAGCATLACMILPVIITASEESLRAVPQGFRDASLAMGATRWQTIRKCVLPYSLPGILTSSLLSIARVAGETAPIMFTAAVAARDNLPWEGILPKNAGVFDYANVPFEILSSQVQALPYHIYTLAARIPKSEFTEKAQFGSVFIFLSLVALLSFSSMILRNHLRNKLKW
jgi:phosphate transport system permease protein